MGSEFSGSHRRLRMPSDTFENFHRWIHKSDQEYRVFHPRGYLSLLSIPNTCIFHFLFILCNCETHFGRCPILPSPPSNTKHMSIYHVLTTCHRTPNIASIYQPCTLTRLMRCPHAYAIKDAIACYIMSHA